MSVRHVIVTSKLVMVDETSKPLSSPAVMTDTYVWPEDVSLDEMKEYIAHNNEHLREDGLLVVEQTIKYED